MFPAFVFTNVICHFILVFVKDAILSFVSSCIFLWHRLLCHSLVLFSCERRAISFDHFLARGSPPIAYTCSLAQVCDATKA